MELTRDVVETSGQCPSIIPPQSSEAGNVQNGNESTLGEAFPPSWERQGLGFGHSVA